MTLLGRTTKMVTVRIHSVEPKFEFFHSGHVKLYSTSLHWQELSSVFEDTSWLLNPLSSHVMPKVRSSFDLVKRIGGKVFICSRHRTSPLSGMPQNLRGFSWSSGRLQRRLTAKFRTRRFS